MGNYGIVFIMGHAGFISSTVVFLGVGVIYPRILFYIFSAVTCAARLKKRVPTEPLRKTI